MRETFQRAGLQSPHLPSSISSNVKSRLSPQQLTICNTSACLSSLEELGVLCCCCQLEVAAAPLLLRDRLRQSPVALDFQTPNHPVSVMTDR